MCIVRDIDVNISSCVSGMNMKMCQCLILTIPERFLLLFTNSMFLGIFPTEWSTLKVTLLPKTGDKTNPGSLSPISNTNIFANIKILEKLVHKQVTNFLYTNKIISDVQYRFVTGRSTHEAIYCKKHLQCY